MSTGLIGVRSKRSRQSRILCRAALGAAGVMVAFPLSVGAVTNGRPDGAAHPYVGTAVADDVFCSGTLLSPRVFLTAGHCTDAFAASGQQTFVTFDPNANPNSIYVTGTPYTEPGFFNVPPQGVGVPASVGNDIGVVVLDQPVVLSAYGSLPSAHELDGANGTSMTVVGYGAQDWVAGHGGRFPVFTFVRTWAALTLINDTYASGGEFVRLSSNPGGGKGGIGPGDSGAPAFLDDSTTIGAIGSHGASPFGSGSTYFTRLDTPQALGFIAPFISANS